MAEEDALLVDNVEGGLCVDYTDAGIVGRCNSGSNKDKGKVDAIARRWIDSVLHLWSLKVRCAFRLMNGGKTDLFLYMVMIISLLLHERKCRFGYYNNGMLMLNLNKVLDDSDSVYMSSSTIVNSSLWHARLGHVAMMDLQRKMKFDGTIDKFRARLVIQGFRQKEGVDYFDTYALVAHISIIRLLTALEAITTNL
ncbi:zinc finger, CCHC-type containing protein [Tanacetum coccineum]